jgi:hypothetical protein
MARRKRKAVVFKRTKDIGRNISIRKIDKVIDALEELQNDVGFLMCDNNSDMEYSYNIKNVMDNLKEMKMFLIK